MIFISFYNIHYNLQIGLRNLHIKNIFGTYLIKTVDPKIIKNITKFTFKI